MYSMMTIANDPILNTRTIPGVQISVIISYVSST